MPPPPGGPSAAAGQPGPGRGRHRRRLQLVFPEHRGRLAGKSDSKRLIGGNLEVTYNHWPLYTFVKDSGPGTAHGQGLMGFGGTWYVLNASGSPVTSHGS